MPQSDKQPTACDRVLAHYRERVGGAWRPADDILFRAAWNEGAHERSTQLRAEVEQASDLLARARLFLPSGEQATALRRDIDAHLRGERIQT